MPEMIVGLVGPTALILNNRYIYLFGGMSLGHNPELT